MTLRWIIFFVLNPENSFAITAPPKVVGGKFMQQRIFRFSTVFLREQRKDVKVFTIIWYCLIQPLQSQFVWCSRVLSLLTIVVERLFEEEKSQKTSTNFGDLSPCMRLIVLTQN